MGPVSLGRFVISLGVLAILAVLAWFTMEPGKPRALTLVLLGFFTFRVVLGKLRTRYDSKSGESAG
ncbi:MAG: hypothetical protein ACYC46_01350 [Acidobacteriaceae bacterium]